MNDSLGISHKIKSSTWLLLSLFILISVAFKLHRSSIDVWNEYLQNPNSTSINILGKARPIRSDEWLGLTPGMLNQVQKGMPVQNESIGAGDAPLFMAFPAKDIGAWFRPYHFGFFVLDIERGFSFFWAYKQFVLFASIFFAMLLVVRSQVLTALCGALWLFFSPFIQWWFSMLMTEIISSALLGMIGFAYACFGKTRVEILFGSILGAYFTIACALMFYPPFQIAVGYACVAIFMCIALIESRWKNFSIDLFFRIGVLLGSVAAIGGVLFLFVHHHRETISLITNTAYPGKRLFLGGGLQLGRYFSGFLDWTFTEDQFPRVLGNICEASNFLLLWPFVAIIAVLYPEILKRVWPLLLLLVLSLWWMVFGISESVAKLSLLSMVTPQRGMIGVGIASIFFCMAVASHRVRKRSFSNKQIFGAGVAIALVWIILNITANELQITVPFHQRLEIEIVFAAIFLCIATGRSTIAPVLLGVCLPGFMINPIAFGLSPFLKSPLLHRLQEISAQNQQSKWVVFGDYKIAQAMKTVGLTVLHGVQFPPPIDRMKILDPTGANEIAYNRFAHVMFQATDRDVPAQFILGAPDFYTVKVNPCSPEFAAFGATHLVFSQKPSEKITRCLERVRLQIKGQVWTYRLVRPTDGSFNPPHHEHGGRTGVRPYRRNIT